MFFYFDCFGREERRTSYPILSPREYALQKRGKKSFGTAEELPEELFSPVVRVDLKDISEQAHKILDYLNAQTVKHGGDFYMFTKPCKNAFYRAGESFKEKFGFTRESRKSLEEICEFYESKATLKKGEASFLGKPFLRYLSRLGGSDISFYRKNPLYEVDK
jgi:hypothetical protein